MKIINLGKSARQTAIISAVAALRRGGLVIYPTETVYGAGVDAASPQAVAKLAKFKSRPLGKPYSVAAADQKMAERYVKLNHTAKKLYRAFLPGPLTVISKLKTFKPFSHSSHFNHFLAPGVASETGTLGIRISSYPLVTAIVKKFGRPITATSANEAYKKRPYQISDIINQISDRKKQLIDLIIDAGPLPRREPSTVIDTTLDDPVTLRVGDIKISNEDKILSRSPENTQNLAKELWQKYQHFAGSPRCEAGRRAIIFALEGPLGAGKTEFTKGLARAMGIKKEIVSPTYNLSNEYSPALTINHQPSTILHHLDAWRIESGQELENLDFAGIITDKSVIAVEWADRVADTIHAYSEDAVIIWIKIKYAKKQNERLINWGIL